MLSDTYDVNTLQINTLALVYSAVEYCAPVWINSEHTNKLDTQLNQAMRIIEGTLKSTPLKWLPVLSNIAPPKIQRKQALIREWTELPLI